MLRAAIAFVLLIGGLQIEPVAAQPAEIMIAARAGDFNQVKELLAAGAEPDPEGIATPLYFAAQGGHLNIAEILLESGADPNAQSNWGTPLHIASRRGFLEIVRILLLQDADPNLTGGEFDNVPLHEAAVAGDVDIGRLLIKAGANVNARNQYFEPPIHLAVKKNRVAFAELLQSHGAAAVEVAPISKALAEADIEKGRISSIRCGVCHQMVKVENTGGDGPRLWGVVGRPIASLVYPYSDAMRSESGSWSFERLNSFIADPKGNIPGSGMLYKEPVKHRAERINLIAYLRTLSDDPVPLP